MMEHMDMMLKNANKTSIELAATNDKLKAAEENLQRSQERDMEKGKILTNVQMKLKMTKEKILQINDENRKIKSKEVEETQKNLFPTC